MNIAATIIIPVYNSEKTIEDTIRSVLEQSCPNLEIRLVDDGSTDNSRIIVEKLMAEDNRIKYTYQENQGVSAARNLGIELADTKYVAFLDSDDQYMPAFLEKMISRIETTNADLCGCGFYTYSPEGAKKAFSKFKENNFIFNYLLGSNRLHTSTFLIKKELLDTHNIRFNEKINFGEDIEFFVKAASHSKNNVLLKDYLTKYRIEFEDNRLSSFNFDKFEKDKNLINSLIENSEIGLNQEVKDLLLNYRLPALLTYRFLSAFERNESKTLIKKYYDLYADDINKYRFSLSYGLRAFKLAFAVRKLKRLLSTQCKMTDN